jgi:putative tricarboxylic transport membrane protein
MELISWESFIALLLGGLYGAVFGAIPGLTATLAVALFIPIAFFLDPILALPAIIGISSVAIFAGDVGSIVARIPGTPASAAYVGEINKVGRKKGPIYALGISAIGSAVGGIIGTLLLIFSATMLASIARNFSSFEYFWVAILGLTAGIFAAGRNPVKGFVSLLIGLLFATVGIDPTLGYPRFHFDSPTLLGGLDYIVVMIGLFGFSEVLENLLRRRAERPGGGITIGGNAFYQFYVQPLILIFRNIWLMLRSSLIGTFIGFLPGAGADVGAWIASTLQKIAPGARRKDAARAAYDDDTEDDRIVLAGTGSNNAAVASAWIPALALGLPGDTVTAIVLGVFMMKGITPGPQFFQQELGLVWTLYLAFIVANVLLLPALGFVTARIAAFVLRVPFNVLLGVIAALCLVGAYAINNNPVDVWIMAAMGVVALLLKRGGFPLAQVVLGMVLGPIIERSFMMSAIRVNWDLTRFVDRPIGLGLMVATILVIVVGIALRRRRAL